jgi:putative toxin-antitoxin system antitoxin component (TIGR02293 family)
MSSAPTRVPAVSESHVANIQAVEGLATAVFEDAAIAERWLREPNLATENRPPIELLDSPAGFARVTTLLERIEYGVLA